MMRGFVTGAAITGGAVSGDAVARAAVTREPGIRAPLALLALFVLGPATLALHAQQITATVDRNEAPVDSPIRLTVTVTGAQGARPQLPELPDFEVTSAGEVNQFSMVNGRTTTSVRFNYLLAPRRTGTFTIPPVTVEVDGRLLRSRPLTVRIVEATEQPSEGRDVFVSATVSTTEPYVGQQVIYTWRFFTRSRITEPRLNLPSFEGFVMEDLGDVREYEAIVQGQGYRVSEFRKALFPQEEGSLTVPATTLRVQVAVANRDARRRGIFDNFFGRTVTEPRVLRTRPIEMNVRPLPAAPPGFSGLVGDFRLDARLSKQELQVGETATLTYTISGTGNAQMISEPKLPQPPQLKIYHDKPTSDLNRLDSGLSGSKSYSKALVPLVPGEITLPPVSLSYFDVESGSYRTTRAPELSLRVLPAKGGEEELRLTESMAPNAGKVAVRILADDILPVHRGLDAVDPGFPGTLGGGRAVFFSALVAPPLLFLGLMVARRRRERYAADVGWRRRRGALDRARRVLSELEGAPGHAAPDARSAAHLASRALRGYIGDRLNLEGRALTPAEAAQHLRARGAEAETADRVETVLARLEAVQYGAAAGSAGDLRHEMDELLTTLEERLP